MKNKKYFFLLFVFTVACGIVYLVGCSKTTTNEPQDQIKYVNPYDNVSQLHNAVFKNVLIKLQEDKDNNLISADQKEVENKIMNYCRESLSGINNSGIDMYSVIVKNNSDKKLNKNRNDLIGSLSEQQQIYSNKIDDLVTNEHDLNVLARLLNELEQEVSTKLGEADAPPILCKSTVALNSKIFWKNNLSSWVDTFIPKTKLNKATNILLEEESYAIRLAQADAAGALAGTLCALASGHLELVPGMAADGAVYGTAAEAVIIAFEILCSIL